MSEKTLDAFILIRDFTNELWGMFPGEKTPLALYHRLISQVKEIDDVAMGKFVNGFRQFFLLHDKSIVDGKWSAIPPDTRISYGDSTRVYLEIQKYIHKNQKDKDALEGIRQHLIAISALIAPEEIKLQALGKDTLGIDMNSTEGELVRSVLNQIQDLNGPDSSIENPMDAITKVWQSGALGDMISKLQRGISNGTMNKRKLVENLGGAIKAMGSMMADEMVAQCDDEVSTASVAEAFEKDLAGK